MTTFDEREDAYENKFARDEELRFKASARRNKLLGLWIAERLGLSDQQQADAYSRSLVKADLQEPGDEDVLRKIRADIEAANVTISDEELDEKLIYFMGVAIQQLEQENS